jgi:hypothetical protein
MTIKRLAPPISLMESLLDDLGEGFHGEQMEAQIGLIDPEHSGKLERSAFIEWYVKLCESGGDQDGDGSSPDSKRQGR